MSAGEIFGRREKYGNIFERREKSGQHLSAGKKSGETFERREKSGETFERREKSEETFERGVSPCSPTGSPTRIGVCNTRRHAARLARLAMATRVERGGWARSTDRLCRRDLARLPDPQRLPARVDRSLAVWGFRAI